MTMFAERLKETMEKQGRSKYALSKEIGLTYMQMCKYFTSETLLPRLDTAILIADALNVSLDYLTGRDKDNIS